MRGKEKSYRGEWFVPSKEEFKLPGVLTVSIEGRSVIELFGSQDLDGNMITDLNINNNHFETSILLGKTEWGEITLYHYSNEGPFFLTSRIGGNTCKIESTFSHCIIGQHFKSEKDIVFRKFRIHLDGVHQWFDPSLIFFDVECNNDAENHWKHRSIEPIEIARNEEYTVQYQNWAGGTGGNELNLKTCNEIVLEYKESRPLKDFYQLTHNVRSFFMLCMQRNVEIIKEVGIGNEENDIEIITFRCNVDGKNRNFQSFFLQSRNLGRDRPLILLNNWIRNFEVFRFPLEIFLWATKKHWEIGSKTFDSIEYANTILNVVQAIEALGKKVVGEQYTEEIGKFNNKKGQVLNRLNTSNLNQDDKDFIRDNLYKKPKRIKDAILKNVLECIFKSLGNSIDSLVDRHSFDKFSEEIRQCRNDIAHVNLTSDFDLDQKYNLHDLFQVCQILFFGLIGKQLEMTQDEIRGCLEDLRVF